MVRLCGDAWSPNEDIYADVPLNVPLRECRDELADALMVDSDELLRYSLWSVHVPENYCELDSPFVLKKQRKLTLHTSLAAQGLGDDSVVYFTKDKAPLSNVSPNAVALPVGPRGKSQPGGAANAHRSIAALAGGHAGIAMPVVVTPRERELFNAALAGTVQATACEKVGSLYCCGAPGSWTLDESFCSNESPHSSTFRTMQETVFSDCSARPCPRPSPAASHGSGRWRSGPARQGARVATPAPRCIVAAATVTSGGKRFVTHNGDIESGGKGGAAGGASPSHSSVGEADELDLQGHEVLRTASPSAPPVSALPCVDRRQEQPREVGCVMCTSFLCSIM